MIKLIVKIVKYACKIYDNIYIATFSYSSFITNNNKATCKYNVLDVIFRTLLYRVTTCYTQIL